jgi:hypothetical protein
VIRTVVAVTAPFDAPGPKALTQSPTARSVEAADLVALTVVDPDVVIFRSCVFGVVGLEPLELPDLRPKVPGLSSKPDTETVEPLTAVTLPVASVSEPRPPNRAPDPPGNGGRCPGELPLSPVRKLKPPPGPPTGPAPPGGVPALDRAGPEQDPDVEAGATEMLRAAMVVLDDFDGVPVTVTQSPAVRTLTASDTVFENCVVGVQLTVVWPVAGFWTSMLDPDNEATDPLAPSGAGVLVVAAPAAAEPMIIAATSAVAPVLLQRAQRPGRTRRVVRVCM